MKAEGQDTQMTFWDHLEEFRGVLVRSAVALILAFIVLFFFKSFIFDGIVLWPTRADFWLYRILGISFSLQLINIDVTAQFFIHMRVTFFASLLVCFPFLCYQLWGFVAPALYRNEKRAVKKAFGMGAGLFYIGAAVGYFIVMPLVVYFFQGYQVSANVVNTFALGSYISIFSSMLFMMGLLFEFPSVVTVLSALGLVTRGTMRRYRRHAILVILIVAAVLTPTGDPFTMLVVAIPLYLLYEGSILLCKPDQTTPANDIN